MKKAVIFATVVLFVFGITACKGGGGGKYADVKEVLEKYVTANEKFVSALDNIKSADDVVAALNALTATTKELAPKMKAVSYTHLTLPTKRIV